MSFSCKCTSVRILESFFDLDVSAPRHCISKFWAQTWICEEFPQRERLFRHLVRNTILGSQHPSPNVKTFCKFEPQIWLEIITSRDAKSACFKGSRTSCREIIFGIFWRQILARKDHITWWMLTATPFAFASKFLRIAWLAALFQLTWPPHSQVLVRAYPETFARRFTLFNSLVNN